MENAFGTGRRFIHFPRQKRAFGKKKKRKKRLPGYDTEWKSRSVVTDLY